MTPPTEDSRPNDTNLPWLFAANESRTPSSKDRKKHRKIGTPAANSLLEPAPDSTADHKLYAKTGDMANACKMAKHNYRAEKVS
ncbi:MAG: hypothetical protein CMM01_11435 [Rhodopirellula sp.]|nr:hypothetical protein [Rhodopirellula sp.]OUX51168.1 MAG: hypothetical protein CBE43_04240 [Rhodopirellula sp. TMED283]